MLLILFHYSLLLLLSHARHICDPLDCSSPGSSVHGIFQARILEWVAISLFRGSSQTRDWTHVSCIDRWILHPWAKLVLFYFSKPLFWGVSAVQFWVALWRGACNKELLSLGNREPGLRSTVPEHPRKWILPRVTQASWALGPLPVFYWADFCLGSHLDCSLVTDPESKTWKAAPRILSHIVK